MLILLCDLNIHENQQMIWRFSRFNMATWFPDRNSSVK